MSGNKKQELIEDKLDIQPGDIVMYEMPYDDPEYDDFFPFKEVGDFEPGHTAMWVGGVDKPVAHAVQEGYKLPGLRLTQLSDARCVVFRYNNQNDEISTKASEMMKTWASSEKLINRKEYEKSYPQREWKDRFQKDIKNFFEDPNNQVSAPANIYPQPRAQNDISDSARNKKLKEFSQESLRRVIKFASRANVSGPNSITKGQRCTPFVVASLQAAILEPIVKKYDDKKPFKDYKNKSFLEYADEVLIENWRDTELGKLLIEAEKTNNYEKIFPRALLVDQRYVLPKDFFNALKQDKNFRQVGHFSSFQNEIEITDSHGETFHETLNQSRYRK